MSAFEAGEIVWCYSGGRRQRVRVEGRSGVTPHVGFQRYRVRRLSDGRALNVAVYSLSREDDDDQEEEAQP